MSGEQLHALFAGSLRLCAQRFWHAIGEVNGTLIVTVVHTYQTDDLIRIIAARFANREERELYAEAYGR
jgi:uncharacterized DUF497 family protein